MVIRTKKGKWRELFQHVFKQSKDASWGSFHELWMTLGYLFCCCWSVIKLCLTLCDPMALRPSLSFTISQSLLKFMSTESVMLFNHFVFCCLLLYPSVFPSIKVFSSELALCIRWPKYWSFSISSSNGYSGLTSFRIDWVDLLAVQVTLKNP